MILKLKLQYFGLLMRRVDSLEKTDAGSNWGQEEKGMTEVEMAGWHHLLDGLELEWTPGVGDGQGGLACCDSWGLKESDTTEWLNWTELNWNWYKLQGKMNKSIIMVADFTTFLSITDRSSRLKINQKSWTPAPTHLTWLMFTEHFTHL